MHLLHAHLQPMLGYDADTASPHTALAYQLTQTHTWTYVHPHTDTHSHLQIDTLSRTATTLSHSIHSRKPQHSQPKSSLQPLLLILTCQAKGEPVLSAILSHLHSVADNHAISEQINGSRKLRRVVNAVQTQHHLSKVPARFTSSKEVW